MRWQKVVTVAHAHAEGEVGRVITGGVLDVPGKTMFDKKSWLEKHGDDLRRMILFEPRGSAAMSVNLLLAPTTPKADAGFIVMESTDYPPMSGSNAMCVTTVLLETGILPMKEPTTKVVLDTPAGLVTAIATCRDGKCERVSLESVPAFVTHLDATLEVEGLGTVTVDVAYGGAVFAMADAAKLGFKIEPSEARDIVAVGRKITAAADAQLTVKHPRNPKINRVAFTHFGGPPRGATKRRRSTVVIEPGRLDRSPCGTGTMAKLAQLTARGQLKVGEKLFHDSITGTNFIADVVRKTKVGRYDAVVPRVSGRAWIAGLFQFGHDPSDPVPEGFTLPDTWGDGPIGAPVI
jgi:proline racemase